MSGDLTARDVIARAIRQASREHFERSTDRICAASYRNPPGWLDENYPSPPRELTMQVDAVLAALAAAGKVIVDVEEWEWGVRNDDGTVTDGLSGKGATYVLAHDGGTLVCRRPAGEWEVAPDA